MPSRIDESLFVRWWLQAIRTRVVLRCGRTWDVYRAETIHFNRVFHYFHHPFWGIPIFGNTHILSNCLYWNLSYITKFHPISKEITNGFHGGITYEITNYNGFPISYDKLMTSLQYQSVEKPLGGWELSSFNPVDLRRSRLSSPRRRWSKSNCFFFIVHQDFKHPWRVDDLSSFFF